MSKASQTPGSVTASTAGGLSNLYVYVPSPAKENDRGRVHDHTNSDGDRADRVHGEERQLPTAPPACQGRECQSQQCVPQANPSGETRDRSVDVRLIGTGHVVQTAPYFRVKSWIDRGITALLMLLALPVMVVVSAAVLLCDGRPVFYRQVRMGRGGREFWIWKFRTMKRDAEKATGAVWSSKADPRVTRLGRWLRCSHLDELPQFFNILTGEMNLIGPRPERPEFAQELERQLSDYRERTRVRPGITGLAQLRLGYDHSIADVEKKIRLDLKYIRSASLIGDLWLLTCTLPYIAKQLFGRWVTSLRSTAVTDRRQRESLEQLVTPPARYDDRVETSIREPHLLQVNAGADRVDPNAAAAEPAQRSRSASRVADECA